MKFNTNDRGGGVSDKSPIARALTELTTERENLAARLAKVDAAIDTLRDLFHLKAERPAPTARTVRATTPAHSTNGHGKTATKLAERTKAVRAALANGPMKPGDLSAALGLERSLLRKHLALMESDGVIVSSGVTAGRRIALAGRAAKEAG